MLEKKAWLYEIEPFRTISVGGRILATISSRKAVTLKIEESFGVVCSDPETGEFFELGTFATVEQAQNFLEAHKEWRMHPQGMCTTCSATYPIDEPTPEDVVAVVS
jgi:hypothetical protein